MAGVMREVTVVCFASAYAIAWALELVGLVRPRPAVRWLSVGFGCAGLLTHSLFLAFHPVSLDAPFGSLVFLALVLAVFYFYGTLHHRRFAWGVFVLPLVLGLLAVARRTPERASAAGSWGLDGLRGERFWGAFHGGLLFLACVGVSVGFLSSVMYLFQAQRLRAKALPGRGLRLFSLERLEEMNRRAVNGAFPLLTAGVLVGTGLLLQRADRLTGWSDPKILGALLVWGLFALLLVLRYGYHLRGRRAAILTIAAFTLMVFTLASSHTTVQGGGP